MEIFILFIHLYGAHLHIFAFVLTRDFIKQIVLLYFVNKDVFENRKNLIMATKVLAKYRVVFINEGAVRCQAF